MARFCVNCGNPMDDSSAFCQKCGQPIAGATATPGGTASTVTTGGLTDNVAGLLAYITIIPAIIFLVTTPYNRNKFVRFHSFQCLFFAVAWIVINIVLMMIPVIGWMVMQVIHILFLIVWIVLLIKAYQGQMFKLPVIGDLAEKQANAI
ncbi:MAG TPA: DUF4870 domain-containing protein [Terriglobales bacterium]|nr:DUF4870 domain-containing protein [Terriglobales bacterium]